MVVACCRDRGSGGGTVCRVDSPVTPLGDAGITNVFSIRHFCDVPPNLLVHSPHDSTLCHEFLLHPGVTRSRVAAVTVSTGVEWAAGGY